MVRSITCTFIGLGNMGRELCARIGSAGFPTLAYDVNPEAAKYAEDQFENVTQSDLLKALKNSSVVFSCLPNSNLVREIVDKMLYQEGILDNVQYWVDTTSGHPGESQRIAADLKSQGVVFFDCAVSGGPAGAAAGTLTAMVGGDPDSFTEVENIISSFAKNIVHLGPSGAGHAVKAVNNTLLAANICSVSEGLIALKKYGIPLDVALKAINTSSGRSWVTQQRIPEHVLTRGFDYGFSLGLLCKDVDTCMGMLQESSLPAPSLRSTRELIQIAKNILGDESDHLEIAKIIEDWSGETIE